MLTYPTNSLLDLCRHGISLKNERTDTAARELCSYIVYASLLETNTEVPSELQSRVDLLNNAVQYPQNYPADIVEEEVDTSNSNTGVEDNDDPTPPAAA